MAKHTKVQNTKIDWIKHRVGTIERRVNEVSQTRSLINKVGGTGTGNKKRKKSMNKDEMPDQRLELYTSRKGWIVTGVISLGKMGTLLDVYFLLPRCLSYFPPHSSSIAKNTQHVLAIPINSSNKYKLKILHVLVTIVTKATDTLYHEFQASSSKRKCIMPFFSNLVQSCIQQILHQKIILHKRWDVKFLQQLSFFSLCVHIKVTSLIT